MFARLKKSSDGKRVYVQIVANERVRSPEDWYGHDRKTRQRVVATLGRVDHLGEGHWPFILERITGALNDVRICRPKAKEVSATKVEGGEA